MVIFIDLFVIFYSLQRGRQSYLATRQRFPSRNPFGQSGRESGQRGSDHSTALLRSRLL